MQEPVLDCCRVCGGTPNDASWFDDQRQYFRDVIEHTWLHLAAEV